MENVTPELEQFARTCEHLLSLIAPPTLSEEERRLVEYYNQELFARYGKRAEGF